MPFYYENSFISSLVDNNRLLSIEPILKHTKPNILQFYNPVTIYGCLNWFVDPEIKPDFIHIDNPEWRPHIVLLHYQTPLLFLGYYDDGSLRTIIPLPKTNDRRNNHQIFNYRHMVFARIQALEKGVNQQP